MARKPRVILWDLETAPIIAATFSLYPERIYHSNILEDWFIICACWKELGEKEVHHLQIKTKGDDKELVSKLRDIIADADCLVYQNGDRFDLKKLNSRLIYHRLPPLPPVPTVDTLKQVKKIGAMTSNRLDYLGAHLIGQKKIETGRGLWLKAMNADKTALKDMVNYCKQDVNLLEKLYLRLLPYMKTHPHLGVLRGHDKDVSCRVCDSTNIEKRGTYVTNTGALRQKHQCKKCGSWTIYPVKKV